MLAKSKIFAFVIAAAVAPAWPRRARRHKRRRQDAPPSRHVRTRSRPTARPITLGLAGYAKVLCSAVFVSGREAAEAFGNSGFFLFPSTEERRGVTYDVDREQQARPHDARQRHARAAKFYGDQGCIIHRPSGHDGIYFTPVPVKTRLPDAATQPWPMGDAPPTRRRCRPRSIARASTKAVDVAFADPEGLTAAFIVVYKGRSSASATCRASRRTRSSRAGRWARASTATLFALLVKDGVYKIDEPAPVPEWQTAGRSARRDSQRDLLRMSSGLQFIAGQDPDYTPDKGYPDHTSDLHGRDRRVRATRSRGRCSSRRTPKAAIATPIR